MFALTQPTHNIANPVNYKNGCFNLRLKQYTGCFAITSVSYHSAYGANFSKRYNNPLENGGNKKACFGHFIEFLINNTRATILVYGFKL